jgi:hypothetical protein
MALPSFEDSGLLPPGEHDATWSEFLGRFATNEHRVALGAKLEEGLRALWKAGARQAWINGSYVTDVERPGDVDVLYDARHVRPKDLDPGFRDPDADARRAQFGGDYLAVDADHHLTNAPAGLFKFFQHTRDGEPKGIVRIDLSTMESDQDTS